MEIQGYSGYRYCDNKVFNSKGKEIKISSNKTGNSQYCKIKNDDGKWKSVAISTIKSLAGDVYNLDGFVEIPNTDGLFFINEFGKVVSFASNKRGLEVLIQYRKDNKKYPYIGISYCGCRKWIGIHQLLAVAFLDKDYVEKGLVCMHLDNDKNNHTLSNIKLGTYSENNKQAYDDGLNCGNIEGVN